MIRRVVPNVLLVVLALFSLEGCTKNTRLSTVQASLTAVNAARDGFVVWDRGHQEVILEESKTREEFTAKITAYRKQQAEISIGFEIVYRALAVAATQTDEPSLKAALEQASKLLVTVQKLTGGT